MSMHIWKKHTLFGLSLLLISPSMAFSANQLIDALCPGGAQAAGTPAAMGGAGGLCSNLATSTYGDILSGFEGSSDMVSTSQMSAVQERLEEVKGGKPLGMFISSNYSTEKRKNTILETGYDSKNTGATIGVDYPFSDVITAGLAVGYSRVNATFRENAGSNRVRSISVIAYTNVMLGDDIYLDAHLGNNNMKYTNNRNVVVPDGSQAFTGNTTGTQWIGGLSIGKDFLFDHIIVTPELSVDYSSNNIKGYSEARSANANLSSYNLVYPDQSIRSTLSKVSVSMAWVGTDNFTPAISFDYLHEFGKKNLDVTTNLADRNTPFTLPAIADRPDKNFFAIRPSASYIFPNGGQLFGNIDILVGDKYLTRTTYNAGARWEF